LEIGIKFGMPRLRELKNIICLECGLTYTLKSSLIVHIDLSEVQHPDNDSMLLIGFSPISKQVSVLGDTEEEVLEGFSCEICKLITDYLEAPYELDQSEADLAKIVLEKVDYIEYSIPKGMNVVSFDGRKIRIRYEPE
jgi:hypothetical protein